MRQIKTYLMVVLISTLAACAHLNPPNKEESPQKKEDVSTKENVEKTKKTKSGPPSSFKLSGVIAVNKQGKGWNASLNWTQNGPNQYKIRLSGPFGGKTVIIDKKNSLITYRDGAKTIKAKNGEDLLRREAKISLPVNDLYYWVRGIPAPGKIQGSKKDASGRYESIKQSGFMVTYGRYMTDKNGNILPSKIRLQGNGVTIKMVIRSWS
ncbi:MAG: lipoprotein insertase outer membrane protein LolB [Legionellaceae bacterium]|nr:lipoprotein insertase outer membrane protein LolB [Legionellaceae bacterium]